MKEKNKVVEKVKLKGSLMDLSCHNCGKGIPLANFNVNNTIAKCESCNSLFSYEDDIFFRSRRGRPEFMMPEGTDAIHFTEHMEIRVDWFKSANKAGLAFLTIFALIWCGILAGVIGAILATTVALPIIFLSGHIAVGGGLIYYLLGQFLNTSDLVIDKDHIRIIQKPIKSIFHKEIVVKREDIKQLYVTKYVASRSNSKPNYAYRLEAILKKGKPVKLLSGMNKETQLYLEQEIERYLRIEDAAVIGETLK